MSEPHPGDINSVALAEMKGLGHVLLCPHIFKAWLSSWDGFSKVWSSFRAPG